MSKMQVNVEDLKSFADIIGDIENQCDDALRHLNWDFSSFLADLPGVSPKRVKEVEEIYRNVIKKYQAKLDHAQQLVKRTEAAMRQAEKNIGEKAGEFGLEMLGYYDVQRVFGEYDPITGEKVSGADRLFATGMLALSLYPPGKAVGVTGKVAIKGANAGTKTSTKFGLSSFAKSLPSFTSLKNVVSTGKVLEVFKGVYKQVIEAPLAATKLWLDRTVRQIADFLMPVNGPQLATANGMQVPVVDLGRASMKDVVQKIGGSKNFDAGTLTFVQRIADIEVKFIRNPKHDPIEFARQLKDQELGMNELTIDEFLKNRNRYLKDGRALEGDAAQKLARKRAVEDKIDEFLESGLSYFEAEQKANKWIKGKAVLHNPDQIAGGNPLIIGDLGDFRVNSSIGIQWRYRIKDLDHQIREIAKEMTEEEKKLTYLKIKLRQ